jgi:hypothetical protein
MLEAGRRGNGGHQTKAARVTEALDRGNGGVERPASTGRDPGGDQEERRVALEAWRRGAGSGRWRERRRRIEAAEVSRGRQARGRVTGGVKSEHKAALEARSRGNGGGSQKQAGGRQRHLDAKKARGSAVNEACELEVSFLFCGAKV